MSITKILPDQPSYQSWLDVLYKKVPTRFYWTSTLAVGALYGIGYVLALFGNYEEVFLRSKILYLCLFGIWWVSSSLEWGKDKFLCAIKEACDCYFDNADDLRNFFRNHISIVFNNKVLLICSLVVICYTYYQIIFTWWLKLSPFNKILPFPIILEDEWLEHRNVYSLVTMFLYSGISVMLFALSGLQILFNVLAVITLSVRKLAILPQFAVVKLRKIVIFNINGALAWFVGAFIVEMAIFQKYTPASVGLIASIVIGGLMTSLLPHIFISSSIRKAKNKILLDIIKALPLNIKTGDLQGYEKLTMSDGTKLLLETLKEVRDTKTLFFDLGAFARFSSFLLPIIGPIIKNYIPSIAG
jgi:hypothetical protein